MAYDGIFLNSLTKEFKENLIDKRLEKIMQHSDQIISLSFSRLKKFRLHISIASDAPFVAFNSQKLPNPENAPMFCMLLRKHLSSGILKDVKQLHNDRILSFEFQTYNEMKDLEKKCLIIEIMGRHSNLILIDSEMNIIDSLKHVNPLMSKRPMGPGYIYSPPFEEKISIHKIKENFDSEILSKIKNSDNAIKHFLLKEISGFSPQISINVLKNANVDGDKISEDLSEEKIESIRDSLIAISKELNSNPLPYLYENKKGKVEISNIKLDYLNDLGYEAKNIEAEKGFEYSELSCIYFDKKGKNDILIQRIKSLEDLINQVIDKENKRIKNLTKDIKNAENYEKYKLYGELCMANIHLIKKGMKTVNVYNYYENKNIDIPLKYDKSPSENAESFFKRYQKMKKTLSYAAEQIELAKNKIEHLESVLHSLEQSETLEDLNAIREELVLEKILKEKQGNRKKKIEKKLPPREFTSPNGFTIKVGRNNFQNDELTLKTASKNHIWLHTKIIPSSHVILCGKFEEVKDEDIFYAASVCAYYSKARNSENVPIDLTEVKFVSKPKGAKPGKVIYVDYKTIYVNPLKFWCFL